jgi:hypothetical protein
MPAKKGIYIFTLLGLILGFTLDTLYNGENQSLFYYSLITLFCLLYAMTFNETHILRLVVSSFIVALFLSLPLLPMKNDANLDKVIHWGTFLCAFPIFTYVGHCFHYAYHHDNSWKINYSSLFTAVWNTVPLLFVAFIFTCLANLLIFLAAFIFKTAGYIYLWNLFFDNEHFRIVSNTILYFIGLSIGQQNIIIINSLSFLLLRMMYYLFPFLALISVLYFILYFIHAPVSEEDRINPLFILTPLVFMGILFFNAYYQDGSEETQSHYPFWLQYTLKVYRVILLCLTLMMAYRMMHGNALDINVVIYIVSLILFSIIYALSACFTKDKERILIQKGNIATALYFFFVLFLLNIPYLPIAFNVGTDTNSQPTITQSQ